MPAVLFEKSQQIGRENFAIRGLQFCGFIKRHSSPTNTAASRVKPPPHHVKVTTDMAHPIPPFTDEARNTGVRRVLEEYQ